MCLEAGKIHNKKRRRQQQYDDDDDGSKCIRV